VTSIGLESAHANEAARTAQPTDATHSASLFLATETLEYKEWLAPNGEFPTHVFVDPYRTGQKKYRDSIGILTSTHNRHICSFCQVYLLLLKYVDWLQLVVRSWTTIRS